MNKASKKNAGLQKSWLTRLLVPTLFPFLYHFTQKGYPLFTYFLLRNDTSFTYLFYNFTSTITAVNELVHVNTSENKNVFATF